MDRYPPIPPELPPEPEGYNPDYFANRRYELRLIRRKVDEGLTKQPIIEPLVHIWGIRGMGKSWLMRHLDALYRFKPDEATVSILVDFSKSQFSHWVPSTITDLLQAVVDDIRIQLPEGKLQDVAQSELSAFQSELEEIGQDSKRTPTHLSETFVALICQLSRAVVPLLLFDTTEILDEDDFFWLESHLIEPIVRTDRVVVVVAGRKEIPRWREFGARQRL
ncbi:MAG: ATP-binding protein, partial [Anaerolineae bacterium]|nr:ATP-binding protein [Anaerolineae bacterium]